MRKSPLTPSRGTVQGGKRGAWPSGCTRPPGPITGVSGLPSPGRRAKAQQLRLRFRDLSPQEGLGLRAESSAPRRRFSIHLPALFGVWMSPRQGRRWHGTVLPWWPLCSRPCGPHQRQPVGHSRSFGTSCSRPPHLRPTPVPSRRAFHARPLIASSSQAVLPAVLPLGWAPAASCPPGDCPSHDTKVSPGTTPAARSLRSP